MTLISRSCVRFLFGLAAVCLVFSTAWSTEKAGKTLTSQSDAKRLKWDELKERYTCPTWFRDAKFGIWTHWGPQTVPASGGGWYARHMYMQNVGREKWGANAYPHHVKTYGHPSVFGFKDVINLWKAERFEPDALMKYFKDVVGCRYFFATANHHDHFDCFDSTHLPWNSVNMGPKRDIVGDFKKAADKHKLRFGITSHDNRHWSWFATAFGADKTGPKKGVPYDGYLTKADGKGTWWEGYDPADLYGPPPKTRTPEMEKQMKENWLKRHLELVNKYEPDLLYYDAHGFSYGEYGIRVAEELYNNSLRKHGSIQAVLNIKSPSKAWVYDIERGGSHRLEERPWQTDTTFASWFYKPDTPVRHNARTIIESLVDIVSKNGNLLFNVELKPDGTIPAHQRKILDAVGAWMKINGEAIYGTRPWKVYGDGPSTTQKEKKKHHFNERTVTSPPYEASDVRFTTKGNTLYVIVLNPRPGVLKIPTLGQSAATKPNPIKTVTLLGTTGNLVFTQTKEALNVTIPKTLPSDYSVVLKLE